METGGTLDTSFNPGASLVWTLAVQADGRIVVSGYFTQFGGQPRNAISRVNPDGTLDAAFNPGAGSSLTTGSAVVNALALQADDKIVVGGNFTQLGGQPRNLIGRLRRDGTLDPYFNPGASGSLTSSSPVVNAVAAQADGKVLVGGNFTQLAGQPRNHIGRLISVLQIEDASSRKMHGELGPFDVNLPLTGAPGVECRSAGSTDTLVFSFSNNLASGNASVTGGTGVAGTPVVSGETMTVPLSGVTDVQKITVSLTGLADSFGQTLPTIAVQMAKLIGDSNGDGTVNSGDATQTRSRSGQVLSSSNFRSDCNGDGGINSGDAYLVRSRSGNTLPP